MDDIRFDLTPSELKAIEDHKYFLSQERGAEVSIEEAIGDFLRRYAESWRREKVCPMCCLPISRSVRTWIEWRC